MKVSDIMAAFPCHNKDHSHRMNHMSLIEKWAKEQSDKLIKSCFDLAEQRKVNYRDAIVPIVYDAKNQWESVCHQLFGNDSDFGHVKFFFQKRLIKACILKKDHKWIDVCKHFFPERYEKIHKTMGYTLGELIVLIGMIGILTLLGLLIYVSIHFLLTYW